MCIFLFGGRGPGSTLTTPPPLLRVNNSYWICLKPGIFDKMEPIKAVNEIINFAAFWNIHVKKGSHYYIRLYKSVDRRAVLRFMYQPDMTHALQTHCEKIHTRIAYKHKWFLIDNSKEGIVFPFTPNSSTGAGRLKCFALPRLKVSGSFSFALLGPLFSPPSIYPALIARVRWSSDARGWRRVYGTANQRRDTRTCGWASLPIRVCHQSLPSHNKLIVPVVTNMHHCSEGRGDRRVKTASP